MLPWRNAGFHASRKHSRIKTCCFLNTLGTRHDISQRERPRDNLALWFFREQKHEGKLERGKGAEGRGEPDPGDPEDRRPSKPNFCVRSRRLGCLLIIFIRVGSFIFSQRGFVPVVFCDAECSPVLFPEYLERIWQKEVEICEYTNR